MPFVLDHGFLATRLTRRRETRYLNDEFVMVLLSMFLVAHLSWEHHLVFVLPAALLVSLKFYTVVILWLYFARRLWKVSRGETVEGAEIPVQVPVVS